MGSSVNQQPVLPGTPCKAVKRRLRWSGVLGSLCMVLVLAGCDPASSGPMLEIEGAPTVILAPILRGASTPTYTVDRAHPCRLESPAPSEGSDTAHPGSAMVLFAHIAVELDLQAGKARLRCVRPPNATDLQPLQICTFAGDIVGFLEIDQEVTLEGFLGRRAGLQFDCLGGTAAAPRGRVVLDPLPVLKILNHSPRAIAWTDLQGEKRIVPPLDRAEMVLSESLEHLHKTEIQARDLRVGQLYKCTGSPALAAPGKTNAPAELYIACSKNNRLILLTVNPQAPFAIPLGDQTALVAPAPGAQMEIEGRWTLQAQTAGGWLIQPQLGFDGSFPILFNPSRVTIVWRSQVTAEDIDLPARTWRTLQPLP